MKALSFHAAVPPPPKRPRGTHDATIGAFLKSRLDSAVLEAEGRDAGGVCHCLMQRIRKLGLEGQVVAIQRQKQAYLVRRAAYDDGLGR